MPLDTTIKPVSRWIVCIGGFLQNEGVLSGIEILQDQIHRQCGGENTRVLFRAWNDSPKHIAERIWNRRPYGAQPAVILLAYSYGGGTAVRIAKELKKRGVEVSAMVLTDAVWRPGNMPAIVSLLPWWTLKVPSNVWRLFAFRQEGRGIKGHKFKIDDSSKTEFAEQVVVGRGHRYMDELPAFVDQCLEVSCPEGPQ